MLYIMYSIYNKYIGIYTKPPESSPSVWILRDTDIPTGLTFPISIPVYSMTELIKYIL